MTGPQTALAYIVDNQCPYRTSLLAEYIGRYPKDVVVDHLIACRIANAGPRDRVIGELIELFADAAAIYERKKTGNGYLAAVARHITFLGAALYHGANRVTET